MNAKQIKEQEAENAIARLSAECAAEVTGLTTEAIVQARRTVLRHAVSSEPESNWPEWLQTKILR